VTLCPSNPLISLLQGDEEAGGSRITLARMLVGCGMFVWEWSWEWNLQPSKKKTITLLSPSTQKIELGTSSLMISIFNGAYRFI
jgi:hypothetical protein